MKIAIASTFHPYRGGIAQFNDAMTVALRADGHMVNCFNWSRQYPSILFPGVAQTKTGTSTPPHSTSAPLDSISQNSWRKTAKIILCDGGVDVVILPFWHSALAPALRGVAKSIKRLSPETKVIAIMHNATSHDGKASDKWLTRRFLKRVDNAVTLSKSVTQDVIKLAPDLPIKTLFHPLYDDLPQKPEKKLAREKLGIPVNAKNIVLFFGLIRPYKGLEVLLKATNLLSEDTHLIIAGECYGTWEKYEKIIKTIKEKSFNSAALTYSTSDTSNTGGNLGWIDENSLNKKLREILSSMKENEFTEPITIPGGFMILNIRKIKEIELIKNIDEEVNKVINLQKNIQLNQFSKMYFNKIKKGIQINEI